MNGGREMTLEALAAASHERCLADWRDAARRDPDRLLTQHFVDAHYNDAAAILAALTANGFTIAPVAEAEAGRAMLALPVRWLVERVSDDVEAPEEWEVTSADGDVFCGASFLDAIAAALQDEATDGR